MTGNVMTNIIEKFRGFSSATQLKMLLAISVILIGTGVALWWLMTPGYQPIFSQLRDTDAAEVVKALNELKIPHQFSDDGTSIQVPGDMVHDARMKLVSIGVPSGGHVGFELFNSTDFGATEFAQRINYQRAVQGELERSIATLPGVANVRVHLTIRKKGMFITQNDASKASVTVSMKPGMQLNSRQVAGIRNLVASAVDGLSPNDVVVLGPNGVLAGGGTSGIDSVSVASEDQVGYELRVRDRITNLLGLMLEADSFRVSVDAQINFDKTKTVSEKLLPNENSGSGFVVRKRLSKTSNTESINSDTSSQSQEEYDYTYGKVLEEVSSAPGGIERLSVAVIVPDSTGNVEIEKIKRLLSAAAGLDFSRGDRIEVATVNSVLGHKQSSTTGASVESDIDVSVPSMSLINIYTWISLFIGLFLGIIIMYLVRPVAKELTLEERSAMKDKIKTWLAEGGQAT